MAHMIDRIAYHAFCNPSAPRTKPTQNCRVVSRQSSSQNTTRAFEAKIGFPKVRGLFEESF